MTTSDDEAIERSARKRAWEDAKEATHETLTFWMKDHPGEEVNPDIMRECAKDVQRRIEAILVEQGVDLVAQNTSRCKLLSNEAAGFVRRAHKELCATLSFRKVRTVDEWSHIFPRYPKSVDGSFRLCYDPADVEGMRAAMERYGMFVVRVMTEEQCDETVAAMFEEVNQMRAVAGIAGPDVSPHNPSTWADGNWPSKKKFLLPRPALHPIAFRNRSLSSIREVFTALFQDDRLHATVDHWGITRGGAINPKWAKSGLKPHWDINPWCFQQHVDAGQDPGYQGLVALTDQTEETGCHVTLPGGTSFVKQWIKENPRPKTITRKSKHADLDDPIVEQMQTIPLRRGEMIIWSWGQLHGSTDSHSTDMRLHQYIRLYPAPEAEMPYDYSGHDRYACKRIIRRSIRDGLLLQNQLEKALPDETCRRLFGWEPYPSLA